MPDAKGVILERIRAANADFKAEVPDSAYAAISREYQQTSGTEREAILAMFIDRLREYDARVHETQPEEIANAICAALESRGQSSAVVAKSFPEMWLPEGFAWSMEDQADIAAMSNAEGAIVTCEVAIAHTGTLAVKNARRISLLPDRLLCVVQSEQVVETVPEAFARLQTCAAEAITFISGPSATADIEMTRIRGVHGPRFLDVVIVHA